MNLGRRWRRLEVALCLLAMGCTAHSPEPPLATPGVQPGAPVELPPLDGLEPLVREALLAGYERYRAQVDGSTPSDWAAASGELGMLFHAHGQLEFAMRCYQNAEASAPGDFRWPYYLAQLLWSKGSVDDAEVASTRAVERNPSYVPARVLLGRVHLERNELGAARSQLEQCLALAPSCAAARVLLGRVALRMDDPAAAVPHLLQALAIAPDAGEAHYVLGLAYRDLGDLSGARRHLGHPNRTGAPLDDPLMEQVAVRVVGSRLRQNLGGEHFLRQEYAEARVEYERAVHADPTSATARQNLGAVLTKLGDLEAAQRELEEASRLDSDNPLIHFNLGALNAQLGFDDRAIRHYRDCLSHDPHHADALFNLGNALRRTARFEEAAQRYEEVLTLDPANLDARAVLAYAWMKLGRWQDALDLLESTHRRYPDDLRSAEALARMLAAHPDRSRRDGERARAIAKRIFERERSVSHAEAYAMAAAQVGRFEEAQHWLEGARAAAVELGRPDLVAEIERGLRYCAERQSWPQPWPDSHPNLTPQRQGRRTPP